MYKGSKFKKFCAAVFLTAVAAAFLGGSMQYVAENIRGLGEAEKAAAPAPLPIVPTASPPAKLEVGGPVAWQDKPVEFLEEILPKTTPDPSKTSYPIAEISEWSATKVENFQVSDTSGSGLDLARELQRPLPFSVEDLSKPTVLIYHTHTCEGYMTGAPGFYYSDTAFRSEKSDRNVTVVGEKLKSALEEAGVGVLHDTTIHDAPAFNGAYPRSMETVQSYLEKYPSIKVTIDLHRDSMTTDENLSYKPTARIGGRKAAQVMIITGSDPDGELGFENWDENLIFALKLQKKAADLYGNLMRPVMFCQRKYNMDATNASLIFEVGTEVNTYAEAKYSGTLMGNVVAGVLKDARGEN